jgi:hypothetical protein
MTISWVSGRSLASTVVIMSSSGGLIALPL